MKYGVLGDIHGNISALEVAVARLTKLGARRFISVGDVVGYGAAPAECIELLRQIGSHVVQGNHDAAVSGGLGLAYFNPFAKDAVRWTRGQLDKEALDWLDNLPLTLELEDCAVAHGTFHQPERFDYVLEARDAEPSLQALNRSVCFVGHSHIPIAVLRLRDDPERTAYSHDACLDLSECERALVNVGSVGQPRDEDSRTAFALFDSDADTVRILREEYDVEREARRIRQAGLPAMLADRLFLGI
ncbi:MAG: metallophosphoesterase [Planctomycetes bacterium]|nr:metallophosphoesterase [Planctomycetota bacterium]